MAHVVTDLDTTVSPERVIGALTDFSPKRFDLFPMVDRQVFKLEASGEDSADVTEGTRAVWERGHYDWSQPGKVRIDVTDSNAFKPGSFWLYEVTPRPSGGSHVHMEFDRRPANLKGHVLNVLLGLFGKQIYGKQLRDAMRKVETQAS